MGPVEIAREKELAYGKATSTGSAAYDGPVPGDGTQRAGTGSDDGSHSRAISP